jgi:membrane-bound serine protease (ClpP class)
MAAKGRGLCAATRPGHGGPARPVRRAGCLLGRLLAVGAGLVLCARTLPAQDPAAEARRAPLVLVAEYDGIIHPIAAEFIDELITRADSSGAAALVLVLRTPGGLLESTRTIVSRMIAARTPVVVFVGPSGARAASAGFLITLAADVAAMAPGTHIGAAHPVAAGGGEAGASETLAKKAAADVAAYARTLAAARGRSEALAAAAVTESRAFTEREARAATPPLIDLVAADVPGLLRELDGRSISRFDGRRTALVTRDARVERAEMTWRQRALSAIAHPQVAYLLFSLGMLGLIVELWTPGAIAPGVVGALCLLLAFFGFQVLPVDVTGLVLIVLGAGLLLLELKVPSFGVLGIGGTVALLVGSVMVTRQVPGVQVSYGVILPVVAAIAGILLFLGQLAYRSQRASAATGVDTLVGTEGVVLRAIAPGTAGQIRLRGEIWRAVGTTVLDPGQRVTVTAVDGLTLHVDGATGTPRERGPS